VTYDKYVHYYDMNSEETRKIIMIDESYNIRDIQILEKVEHRIIDILDNLEEQTENNQFLDGMAIFDALEFACKATAPYCGRIIVCSRLSGKHPALNYLPPPNSRPEAIDSHRAL
jgi:hypothetical protein